MSRYFLIAVLLLIASPTVSWAGGGDGGGDGGAASSLGTAGAHGNSGYADGLGPNAGTNGLGLGGFSGSYGYDIPDLSMLSRTVETYVNENNEVLSIDHANNTATIADEDGNQMGRTMSAEEGMGYVGIGMFSSTDNSSMPSTPSTPTAPSTPTGFDDSRFGPDTQPGPTPDPTAGVDGGRFGGFDPGANATDGTGGYSPGSASGGSSQGGGSGSNGGGGTGGGSTGGGSSSGGGNGSSGGGTSSGGGGGGSGSSGGYGGNDTSNPDNNFPQQEFMRTFCSRVDLNTAQRGACQEAGYATGATTTTSATLSQALSVPLGIINPIISIIGDVVSYGVDLLTGSTPFNNSVNQQYVDLGVLSGQTSNNQVPAPFVPTTQGTLIATSSVNIPLTETPVVSNNIVLEAKITSSGGVVIRDWSTASPINIANGHSLHLRWNAPNYTQCLPFFNDSGRYALQAADRAMLTGNTESSGYDVPEVTGPYRLECGGHKNGSTEIHERVINVIVNTFSQNYSTGSTQ